MPTYKYKYGSNYKMKLLFRAKYNLFRPKIENAICNC